MDTDEIVLDSGIPKSRALAICLGLLSLILVAAYFVIGTSMIGLRIHQLNLVGVISFACVAILLLLLGNRFGNQFFREVVIVKDGILKHEERYFWMKRTFFLVRDDVRRFEFRKSAFSFTVLAITRSGRRVIARDVESSRRDEYYSALSRFAPFNPCPHKAEQDAAEQPATAGESK